MADGKRITIDPITRLEGHGKIEIFLNDDGNVDETYFQVPELRGFEKFAEGRPIEEMARITARICGVCPEAHIMAAGKAADAVYGVEIPSVAEKLRRIIYNAFFVGDHTTHFYALSGPDFVVGPDAPKEERNLIGVINKVGKEVGGKVIKMRKMQHRVSQILGGRQSHPVCVVPGGVPKGLTDDADYQEVKEIAEYSLEFAKFTLDLFDDLVLGNDAYVDLILSDTYTHETHNMGLVNDKNQVDFYDGTVRVTSCEGEEIVKFPPEDYLEHIEERVEKYSYLKYTYLKAKGWKGFVDGPDSGVYKATPLSRLNVSESMSTPLAQAEYEKMYEPLGDRPVHHTLATHWARIIELTNAAEEMNNLINDEEIQSDNYRVIPENKPAEGIGVVEAPRGTLYHHYKTDEDGIVEKANLIVGTTNNHAPITMSLKKAASGLIKNGVVNDGILNKIEMGFRAYDPCFSCATHSLPGEMPLQVKIYDAEENLVETLNRD
ncbi:MAG: Ni/Fe hydrogenase subunit alpha [bacterium]